MEMAIYGNYLKDHNYVISEEFDELPDTPDTPNIPHKPDIPNVPDMPNRPGTSNTPNTTNTQQNKIEKEEKLPGKLPQTGTNSIVIILAMVTIGGISIVSFLKYKKY